MEQEFDVFAFSDFIESYKDSLTGAQKLEDIINESKSDHRIKKVAVFYIMKDKDTYNNTLEFAKKNNHALEIVNHALYILNKIKDTTLFKEDENIQKLICFFEDITGYQGEEINIVISQFEFIGYLNILNSYSFKLKIIASEDMQNMLASKLELIDWENLIEKKAR